MLMRQRRHGRLVVIDMRGPVYISFLKEVWFVRLLTVLGRCTVRNRSVTRRPTPSRRRAWSLKKTGNQQGTRWPKGRSGNPKGRPLGSRNRATLAAERLLDGEAHALTRQCIELALDGDTSVLRPALERLVPPRRDRSIRLLMRAITEVTISSPR